MRVKIQALLYVDYRDIPLRLEQGWLALIPDNFEHINHYGIEMAWICDCNPVNEKSPTAVPMGL